MNTEKLFNLRGKVAYVTGQILFIDGGFAAK